METPKKRYDLLDLIRGLALLSMMAYHAAWDLVWLYDTPWPWYHSTGAFYWQQATCWTFILLSGFCAPMGRHGRRRGLLVFACGWVITAVMAVFMPSSPNYFGILVFLGSAMLLTHALKKPLAKMPPLAGVVLSFLLFAATRWTARGYWGLGNAILVLPQALYANYLTAWLGFPFPGFRSTDYFALFPWIFLFLTGYFLHLYVRKRGWLQKLPALRLPVVNWLGRNSLYVYMAHQPVIYALLWVLL